jgi:hypothetical protein
MARKDPVKATVAQIKGVGAKPYTGPGVTKTSRKASSRIISANNQAMGKKK